MDALSTCVKERTRVAASVRGWSARDEHVRQGADPRGREHVWLECARRESATAGVEPGRAVDAEAERCNLPRRPAGALGRPARRHFIPLVAAQAAFW